MRAAARTALPQLLDKVKRLRAAWKVMQEEHGAECIEGCLIDEYPDKISPCTCGLHARQAEARKVLDGE